MDSELIFPFLPVYYPAICAGLDSLVAKEFSAFASSLPSNRLLVPIGNSQLRCGRKILEKGYCWTECLPCLLQYSPLYLAKYGLAYSSALTSEL